MSVACLGCKAGWPTRKTKLKVIEPAQEATTITYNHYNPADPHNFGDYIRCTKVEHVKE